MDAFVPRTGPGRVLSGTLRRQGSAPSYRKLNSDRSTKQGSRKVSDQNR